MMELSPHLMGQLKRYRFVTGAMRGQEQGQRKTKQHGASFEFAEFRSYHVGDDIRRIDWNVFARTNKHVIKTFYAEQERHFAIYLDGSQSMRQLSHKWQAARELAFYLAMLHLWHEDRVTVQLLGPTPSTMSRKKGKAMTNRLRQYLLQLPEENVPFQDATAQMKWRQKSIGFLITDGFVPLPQLFEQLKRAQLAHEQLHVIQLYVPDETSLFEYGDFNWIDCETDERLNVSVHDTIRKRYEQLFRAHQTSIQQFCQQRSIRFLPLEVGEHFEQQWLTALLRAGWLR